MLKYSKHKKQVIPHQHRLHHPASTKTGHPGARNPPALAIPGALAQGAHDVEAQTLRISENCDFLVLEVVVNLLMFIHNLWLILLFSCITSGCCYFYVSLMVNVAIFM